MPIKQKLMTVKAGLGMLSYITARRSCVEKLFLIKTLDRVDTFSPDGAGLWKDFDFTAITENGLLEFRKCPMELDQFAEQIKAWILEAIDSVKTWDVVFREKLGTPGNPLRILATKQEIQECIFFGQNLITGWNTKMHGGRPW